MTAGAVDRDWFDVYGEQAAGTADATVRAGRYASQAAVEPLILADVMAKMKPGPEDRLLDVGCGPGLLLGPLSHVVKEATGIDHPNVLERISADRIAAGTRLLPGRLEDLEDEARFDLIIAYSVLHCLPTMQDVDRFVDRCTDLLTPGGRILLGDVPNTDRKARFLASPEGKAFHHAWLARMDSVPPPPLDAPRAVAFDDHRIDALMQRGAAMGLRIERVAQPPWLPFGHTREDLIGRKDKA